MKKKSLLIAIIVFLFDILIKYIVDKTIFYGTLKSIIPKFFYITKVYNNGAAWSTFEGARFLLIGVAVVSFIFLIIYQKNFVDNRRNSLVYGGLLGNLFDRIVNGYVIDYLKFYIGGYEYPVFNLADVALVIGFILIIYAIFKGEDKHGNNSR